jgi:serine/threonine protein kinase
VKNSYSDELLAKRYQIKKLIEKGGMGEVFLAEDKLLGGTPVAIKFLSQTVSDSQMQANFNREALLSASLSQKSIHIVRAYDYGVTDNGNPYYVMEYLEGKSLKDLIPVSVPLFIHLCRQICLGLRVAHLGVNIDGKIYPLVHRDIKPANIIVIPEPTVGKLVKILDFGIAKFLNYHAVVTTGQGFHGTLPYCSPEQLEGENVDSRSDIYSLGVMMFEMLTGQKPWQPETDLFGAWYRVHLFEEPKTIQDVSPHLQIPQELNNLIMNCLAKKPEQRPQNMDKILQILENIEKFTPINSVTEVAKNSSSLVLINKPAQEFIWPDNKPIQEIVFPQIIDTGKEIITSLWLMLSKTEIYDYANTTHYTRFMFITHPHPMLLWITLLYHQDITPKWLPCYLDMQNSQNLKLVWKLSETENYSLLFFTLESPHKCIHQVNITLPEPQGQNLQSWVEQSQKIRATGNIIESKNWLKEQYKQIQSKILQHLEHS